MFIRKLLIERFRGIEKLEWEPRQGLNCLVGPGDAGKTTVLNAIALLLDPRSSNQASEYDYFRRAVDAGFHIQAVLSGVDEAVKGERVAYLHGWKDGQLTGAPEGDAEAVIVAHVDGDKDLDVDHTLTTPNGDRVNFSASLRRALLLARVSSGDRAANELRLGRGSLLERAVGVDGLRAQLAEALAAAGNALSVPQSTQDELKKLADEFGRKGLPADLGLRFLSPPGQSAVGMIGLTSGTPDAPIPFIYAGQGSRQMALFTIASVLMGEAPVIVIDEPETGLEPYRQRAQITELRRLAGTKGQVFMTTHSTPVLAALENGEVCRLAAGATAPTALDFPEAERLRRVGAFLSRLPILCEGPTEYGFLPPLLAATAKRSGVPSLDAVGISFVQMGGQPSIFPPAMALVGNGIKIGVFLDNEVKHAGLREQLRANPLCALGTWEGACDIEDALARFLPWEKLTELVAFAAAEGGRGTKDLLQQIAQHAGRPGLHSLDELASLTDQGTVRTSLGKAMGSEAGLVDDDRRKGWFKNFEVARALGNKLVEWGLPAEMQRVIDGFWVEVDSRR